MSNELKKIVEGVNSQSDDILFEDVLNEDTQDYIQYVRTLNEQLQNQVITEGEYYNLLEKGFADKIKGALGIDSKGVSQDEPEDSNITRKKAYMLRKREELKNKKLSPHEKGGALSQLRRDTTDLGIKSRLQK